MLNQKTYNTKYSGMTESKNEQKDDNSVSLYPEQLSIKKK